MSPLLPELSEIRRRRKTIGMTQPALARLAGVSQSFIAKVESGKLQPAYEKAAAIFAALEQHEDTNGRKVKDVMRKNVRTLESNISVGEALKLMKRHGISQMPVLKRKAVVGQLTEKGIFDRIITGDSMELLSRLPVEDVMDDPLPTIGPETPIRSVLPLVAHNQAALVLRRGELEGIVTKTDLLR
ncbi:MAG: CBS domain-containing protein [Nanoarchaeota archaeon]|nr:CBS domain-containing protein [Nanoarchaeota archaeon]